MTGPPLVPEYRGRRESTVLGSLPDGMALGAHTLRVVVVCGEREPRATSGTRAVRRTGSARQGARRGVCDGVWCVTYTFVVKTLND